MAKISFCASYVAENSTTTRKAAPSNSETLYNLINKSSTKRKIVLFRPFNYQASGVFEPNAIIDETKPSILLVDDKKSRPIKRIERLKSGAESQALNIAHMPSIALEKMLTKKELKRAQNPSGTEAVLTYEERLAKIATEQFYRGVNKSLNRFYTTIQKKAELLKEADFVKFLAKFAR